MIEEIRRTIGRRIVEWELRNAKDTVTDFTDAVAAARRMLLIMPLGSDYEMQRLNSVMTVLETHFTPEKLTFLVKAYDSKLTLRFPHSKVLRMTPDDFTPFYLPRPNVVQRMLTGPVDVAVDPNLDFDLASAYICKTVGARIRIGFAGKDADLFYNMQIKRDPHATKQQMYDNMAACLNMF